MTVSLVEILAAARAHAAPLAAESAGYLLLAVADHVVTAPRVVQPEEVELAADGSVRIRVRRGVADAADGAEQAVRQLLSRALALSSSVGPALRRAAERREDIGLGALVRELEVALIPVNRSAAKRALSRVHRETERARDSGKLEAWLRAEAAPVIASAPVVTAPVIASAPVVTAPVIASAPVVTAPVAPMAPEVLVAAEYPEPSPEPLPVVRPSAPPKRPAAPPVELTLTPEPQIAVGEPALTRPEPVVARAKERGSSTPRLGTVVTAQTLRGEEQERTERAPFVSESLDVTVAPLAEARAALEPQPLIDPEPSRMPDVLSAMLELHTGVDAEDAPTRLRDVVTAVALPPLLTPEPEQVEDAWLTESSLVSVEVVEEEPLRFVSERLAPELHEALTWNPGPVVNSVPSPPPPVLTLAEPVLEPSPYAPAVLPARSSDVSELLDSFYVSGAAEERELRSALGEMAGIELTPMPHSVLDKR